MIVLRISRIANFIALDQIIADYDGLSSRVRIGDGIFLDGLEVDLFLPQNRFLWDCLR